MSLGAWAAGIAGDDEDLQGILDSIPGPMCGKIDDALRNGDSHDVRTGRRVHEASIGRKPNWIRTDEYGDVYAESDFDDAWNAAEQAIEERDRAREGLEQCRTALDCLRLGIQGAVDLVVDLRRELAAAKARIAELEGR